MKIINHKTFRELDEYAGSLEIIDTHEHLLPAEQNYVYSSDFLAEYLMHYMICDLVSAGFDRNHIHRIYSPDIPVFEKWEMIEPFWERSRNTAYACCMDNAVRILYGIERIERGTILEINERFLRAGTPGFYSRVLKEKCGIKLAILDTNVDFMTYNFAEEYDRDLFRVTLTIDPLICPKSKQHLEFASSFSGIEPKTFEDWLGVCDAMIRKAVSFGAVALKCAVAYQRPLHFVKTEKSFLPATYTQVFLFRLLIMKIHLLN